MSEFETTGPAASPADALWRLYKLDVAATQAKQSALSGEREALAKQVGSKLMHRYTYNRNAKTRPVTQLLESTCPACGTQYAPSHDFTKLTGSGEVRGCYTCGRLLTFVIHLTNHEVAGQAGDNGPGRPV